MSAWTLLKSITSASVRTGLLSRSARYAFRSALNSYSSTVNSGPKMSDASDVGGIDQLGPEIAERVERGLSDGVCLRAESEEPLTPHPDASAVKRPGVEERRVVGMRLSLRGVGGGIEGRSEEHTSELQSRL